MIEKCICGHERAIHKVYPDLSISDTLYCLACALEQLKDENKDPWHNFQLDNLRYIEDLAKEKKLQ